MADEAQGPTGQFTPEAVAPSAPFDPADPERRAEAAAEEPREQSGKGRKAGEKKPKTVRVVYRGPSGALIVEGHELRLHEPTEIPEEVLERLKTHLSDHVVERVK